MRQFLRWEYLLCKRFFRRKSFLVLLLLLPLMGLLIRAGSREKSGILEIGIVAEEKEGKRARAPRGICSARGNWMRPGYCLRTSKRGWSA